MQTDPDKTIIKKKKKELEGYTTSSLKSFRFFTEVDHTRSVI